MWIALLLLYLPVFGHALDIWRGAEELSFGFLAAPIVLVLLWTRRAALRSSRSTGSNAGLIALTSGLLLLLVSRRTGIHVLAGVSFLPSVVGLAAYLDGVTVARLLLFPFALQTVSLSLYRGLLDQVGFTLQGWTAHGATLLATLFGIPVRQSGLDLFVGDQHFVVAQACSGMDALLALLCLGAVFVGLTPASLLRRVILMVLVLPIILSANVIRVTLVLALSRPLGTAVTSGAGHHGLDAVLFLIAALLFYTAGLSLRCAPRFGATFSSSR